MITSVNLPQNPKIIKKQGNLTVFEIHGYYPGYGLTIGNALRRALLSSLPGAAIISAKIEGVNHEFSTIPYVKENVVQILLNLKQIRLKMYGEDPQKLTLDVRGVKKVTAGDIKKSSDVEIVTPDLPIATLTHNKAHLAIELEVDNGLGYVPAEQIQKEKLIVGLLILDATFTPVTRVSFSVDPMRVGDRTDYDLLRLEVETDGTITAEDALKKVSEILVDQFKVVGILESEESQVKKPVKNSVIKLKKSQGGLSTIKIKQITKEDPANVKIEDLKLPTKVIGVLVEAGIKTAAGLSQRKAATISQLPGIGERYLQDIKRVLGRLGLTLK